METLNPLPIDTIKMRYRPLFENISKGFSGSYIGTYKSPKSGITKYILNNKNDFKDIVPNNVKFIFFEPSIIQSDFQYFWLQQLNMQIQLQDNEYDAPVSENIAVLITSIQKYIYDNDKKGYKTCFLINKLENLNTLKDSSGKILLDFYNTLRNVPNNSCSIYFYLSDIDTLNDKLSDFLNEMIYPLRETTLYFPDLNEEESLYTINRLANIYNLKINDEILDEIYRFSGGNYSLMFDAIQIALNMKKDLTLDFIRDYLVNHTIIIEYITKYFESFSYDNRKKLIDISNNREVKDYQFLSNLGIINNGVIKSYVFSNYLKQLNSEASLDPSLGVFSENEKIVIKYLKENLNKLVSKEDLANHIWNKNDETRFSSWALDKFLSRIRRKLRINNPTLRLITIKKKGVMLCQ